MNRLFLVAAVLMAWAGAGLAVVIGNEGALAWRTSDSARGAALVVSTKPRNELDPPKPPVGIAQTPTPGPTAAPPPNDPTRSNLTESLPPVAAATPGKEPAAVPATPSGRSNVNAVDGITSTSDVAPKDR